MTAHSVVASTAVLRTICHPVFPEIFGAVEGHIRALLAHGHGALSVRCHLGNGGVREVMIDAGMTHRFRIPAWEQIEHPRFPIRASRDQASNGVRHVALHGVLHAVENHLLEVVGFGHGQLSVQCEIGRHGARVVTIAAAISNRFEVPADECTR